MGSVRGSVKFGVLLPVTSRGLPDEEDCIHNLRKFAESLRETTKEDTCLRSGLSKTLNAGEQQRYELKVYVGVDECDTFLSSSTRVEQVLTDHGIESVETMVFGYPPGSICAIWRDLARRAHEDQCQYTVLLGDDVLLKTPGWMSSFDKAFGELECKRGVPRGFGCIAFSDRYFPGFPTFPVMGRIHFEIFGGDVLPMDFINQDGDPYLFQLYRRWGCSVMLQEVFLENTMGGSREPRYQKQHHQEWTFAVLDNGISKVRAWLTQQGLLPLEILTLDVVVPTFRVPLAGIENVVNLRRSETCSSMIILIVDDPLSPDVPELKRRYEHDPFVRIRVNMTNMGASEARNRGLSESAADWVLFLDDDVIPNPDVLLEAEKVVRQFPKACGFVGNTQFPDPTGSVVSSAVVLSGVTFFWGITELMTEEIPWGVTANLLIRRSHDDVRFDPTFPKTGGGEDIDFCLRKRKAHLELLDGGEGFRGAPNVIITHPWWNNGSWRSFNHFRKWGIGDGALVQMYPNLSYRDAAPNCAETVLIAVFLCILVAVVNVIAVLLGKNASWIISIRLLQLLLLSIPKVMIAHVLHDIYRHVYSEKDHYLPELRGRRRILAAGESAVVRMFSEWGRLEGMIRRREWRCIGRRFDWFAGRLGDGPSTTERRLSRGRFQLWMQFLIITLVCSSLCR